MTKVNKDVSIEKLKKEGFVSCIKIDFGRWYDYKNTVIYNNVIVDFNKKLYYVIKDEEKWEIQ